MTIPIRMLNITIAGASAFALGYFGIEFVGGFGFNENGFIQQAAYAGCIGATMSLAYDSVRPALQGLRMTPRNLMARMRSRPFARNIARNMDAMLTSVTPVISIHSSICNSYGKQKGRFALRFNNAETHPFGETIVFEGRKIRFSHRYDGKTSAHVVVPTGSQTIQEELSEHETEIVSSYLERWKIHAFSQLMGVDADLESLAVNCALRLPENHSDEGSYPLEDDPDGLRYININLLSSGEKWNSWLYHPEIGVLWIPRKALEEAARNRRDHQLLAAFDSKVDPIASMPIITGNPVAAKEISVAQKLVERYPEMKDASGTPIAPLVKEHLPRLVRAHTEANAAAMATDQIDEAKLKKIATDFEDGLAVITRAVLEGVEAEQRKREDDLTVEITFLKARHPDPAQLSAA